MAKKQEWVTPNGFAAEVGVSARAVLNAVQTGRFTSDSIKKEKTKTGKPRYKINLELGKKQWEVNRKEPAKIYTDDDMRQAKLKEQVAKAALADFDARERDGELINAEEAKHYHAKIASVLLSGVDNQITRMAPSLLNLKDPAEAEKLLRENFMGFFEEFARGCEGKGPYSQSLCEGTETQTG